MTDIQIISRKEALAQGLKHYFTGKPCKHGHLSARITTSRLCATCNMAHQAQYRASEKGLAMKTRANAKNRARRAAGDIDFIKRDSAKCKKWRSNNQAEYNDYMRQYRTNNPSALVRNRLQVRLHHFLAAAAQKKQLAFQEYVGCTSAFLVQHFEKLFVKGMTWENMGEWHIDHIRPCASFDLTDPEQQKQCFHYTNLQPLWAADNLAKSDKWEAAA